MSPEALLTWWDDATKRYEGPRHEMLRRHLQFWINKRCEQLGVSPEVLESVERLEEGRKVITTAELYVQSRVEEGREEGRSEGRHQVLVQLAGTLFGPDAATELAALLKHRNGEMDSSAMVQAMVGSGTPADMLANARRELDTVSGCGVG